MKRLFNKVSIFTILAAFMLTASCHKQENPIIGGQPCDMTFSASIESSDTKTTLGGSDSDASRKILWTPYDSIGITSSSTIKQLVYIGSDSLQKVNFIGSVTPGTVYYAIYPYSASARFASGTFTFALPAVQKYTADSFSGDAFPMVAYGNSVNLNFKNLCGALRLRLKGSVSIASITFQGKASDGTLMKVAGTATVPMNYESVPAMAMSSTATTSVTLDCGTGVALDATTAKTFFIVLPPATYNSFTLTIVTTDGKMMVKTASSPLTIARASGKATDDLQFSESPEINLSETGTANCYIVPSAGPYMLNAKVIGNGPVGLLPSVTQEVKKFHATTTDISPLSAKVLWQDVENLITGVSLDSDGKLHFIATSQKGNALVAVYNNANPEAEGAEILWSWHIWCTDTPTDENYKNWVEREFTLMDRNLGATAALPGSDVAATYGLHYQWGRKDPFSRTSSQFTREATSSDKGTISNTISHPTYYYYNSSDPCDWHYAERNNYLWGNPEGYNYTANYTAYKSVYDPCPPGYMVAPKDTWTCFSSTGGNTSTSSQFNVSGSFSNGWTFYNSAQGSGSTSWYPAAGYRYYVDGSLNSSGSGGDYWSSSPNSSGSSNAGYLNFYSGIVRPLLNDYRAFGFSVRCVRGETFSSQQITAPAVTTTSATSITSVGAISGGDVTSDGGAEVTARGVVWSTRQNPTVESSLKTTDGTGTGTFTSEITGLPANTLCYYRAYATNSVGTSYGEQKGFTTLAAPTYTDLSASGTANCYIVSAAGNYSLNAKIIGNGPAGLLPDISQDTKKFHATTTDISPLSAKLLWEDVEGLISDVSLNSEGKLLFTASSSKGNALVAVYDNANPEAEGAEILWSWHIWCTDTPADENYKNWVEREFTLMDRNLGATAALPGSDVAATYGLHYQWGRKDPFSRTASQLTIEATSSDKGTISNTISHPTYYYYNSSSPYDWHYAERNNYLWGNPEGYNYTANYTAYKSVYDPCPQGYMVAPKDAWTGFTATGDYTNTSSQFNVSGTFSNGWTFYNSAQGSGSTSWYPAAGYRGYRDGSLGDSGSYGGYWSSSPDSSGSYYAGNLFFLSGYVYPLYNSTRASGFSVRCLRVLQGGEFNNFTISSPSLGAATATEVTQSQAKIGGEVTNLGGARVTERGVVYSTSSNPTTSTGTKVTSAITSGTNGKGTFSVDLTALTAGTTYYVRAYAINAAGTGYSEQKSFTTTPIAPTVTTSNITSITSTGAVSGGNITDTGGADVTARGVVWSTSQNPTVALSTKTSDGTGSGSFSSTITGLTVGTTYYVRAYATNSVGTSYGEEKTFTTTTVIPTVTTTDVTSVTSTGAVSGGNITDTGGADVTARGVVWSTSTNPTIALSTKTSDGTGTGSFTSTITGLAAGTTYYVRAYATNSVGTSYGEEKTFTTTTVIPTVTTTDVTSVTSTGALSGGNITDTGGADVTARGVVWSTSQNPTVALSTKTSDGTGSGSFSSTITGLTVGTTYYVRAYATNSVGTSYGEEKTFTTTTVIPTVTTTDVTSVTSTGAVSGGNITDTGGADVTARGVVWSTSSNPTIALSTKTSDGTGTGSFTSTITGLAAGTTYYVRAYATNSAGTSYGEQKSFKTKASGENEDNDLDDEYNW